MLNVTDVLKLIAEGKTLPQEEHPKPSDIDLGILREIEPVLVNRMLEATAGNEDPVDFLMTEMKELAGHYGWFATATVLSRCFARRYRADTVPNIPGVEPETLNLLRLMSGAAQQEAMDVGAWVIPMAILTSTGEEEALAITVCAGFCAAVGHLQQKMVKEALEP